MEQSKANMISRDSGENDIKQVFLTNAISDITTYIQLADTKVSIIMGSLVAIIAGVLACHEPIHKVLLFVKPCSWSGVAITILAVLLLLNLISVFAFGILTIRGHVSNIGYKSKWFLPQPTSVYSFDAYKQDVLAMTDKDVIENMAAELYKLNDINRQKSKTMKWAIRSFGLSLAILAIIGLFLLINTL